MEDALLWVLIFLASLALLIKSSDYFINVAERIGLVYGLSPFVVGAIILGFGTSIPELLTSVFSVLAGSSEIVMGNVIGSNIANILLVLGCSALMTKTLTINIVTIKAELALLAVSTILLGVFIFDNQIHWIEALVLFGGFVGYLLYVLRSSRTLHEIEDLKDNNEKMGVLNWLILAGSGVGIYFGAKYTVEAILKLSQIFEIGSEVIALSLVALGTSLPELIVSIVAAKKGQADMAVGNILGSNIFNVFSVVSLSRIFGELFIPNDIIYFSLPVLIGTIILFFIFIAGHKIQMWKGVIMVILYLFYNVELFGGFLRSMIFSE